MSLSERWNQLDGKQKAVVGAGVLVGGIFAYKTLRGGGATGNASTTSGQGTDQSTAWGLPPGPVPLNVTFTYPQNQSDGTGTPATPGPVSSGTGGNTGGQPGAGAGTPPDTHPPASIPSAPAAPSWPLPSMGPIEVPIIQTPILGPVPQPPAPPVAPTVPVGSVTYPAVDPGPVRVSTGPSSWTPPILMPAVPLQSGAGAGGSFVQFPQAPYQTSGAHETQSK